MNTGEYKAREDMSWWYGEGPMRADHLAMKDASFSVVYIGFRCARSR